MNATEFRLIACALVGLFSWLATKNFYAGMAIGSGLTLFVEVMTDVRNVIAIMSNNLAEKK